jgi:hypothetical protein
VKTFNRQVTSTINSQVKEKIMFKRLLAVSITMLLFALLVFAHGDAEHVMGVINAIQGDHVSVKLQDGKTTTMVMLDKNTKYFNGEKKGKKEDVKVGLRVVIDAKMDTKMKMLLASEVRLGVAETSKDQKK